MGGWHRPGVPEAWDVLKSVTTTSSGPRRTGITGESRSSSGASRPRGTSIRGPTPGTTASGVRGIRPKDELVEEGDQDARCPVHPSLEVQWMEEENWFFRLSAYTEPLLKLLDERPEFIQPEIRRNEIRKVLEGGLDDISVSRSRLPWGVPWPNDPDHIVYVWLDALTNYLTAVGFPDEGYLESWPADVHVIGKDITRFHCIYWPAFLMSAGVELPKTVWAHGFVTYGGRKLSKSAGVTFELSGSHRTARGGRPPVLPAPGSPLERRRRHHPGAFRRTLHH